MKLDEIRCIAKSLRMSAGKLSQNALIKSIPEGNFNCRTYAGTSIPGVAGICFETVRQGKRL